MSSKKMLFTAIAFLAFSLTSLAQDRTPAKPYVTHTMYINRTTDNLNLNLDSLLKVLKTNILDKDPYFTNVKILAHWWGHDSRQVIFVYELKDFNDLDKAFGKQNELLMAYLKANKEFAKELSSFSFPEHHSDEIYRIVAD